MCFLILSKSKQFRFLQQYRKIPNISPGLIEVRKHFLVGLYSGDLYTEGPIFGRTSGLKGDLCMPKNSAVGVQSERLITTFSAKNFKIEQK